jgi:hypothetical protein
MSNVALSSWSIPEDHHIKRSSPRPSNLRNAKYNDEYDWSTVFFDVFRCGEFVVFQGPPFFNLLPIIKASGYFKRHFRFWRRTARVINRPHGSEIWVKSDDKRVSLECPWGTADLVVQPSLTSLFDGRRVLHTLSKNNEIVWIRDWIEFHVKVHGADALLLYDNRSTIYSTDELKRKLGEAFPAIPIVVVDWPFKYGPEGGDRGAVNGKPAPFDSSFAQQGSMQNARHRFLCGARSVLNADIDELVVSTTGRSIFEATETDAHGAICFKGRWVTNVSADLVDPSARRHRNFTKIDPADTRVCTGKWCVVPAAIDRYRASWGVHFIPGLGSQQTLDPDFCYRHLRGISTNWKYDRLSTPDAPASALVDDELLCRDYRSIWNC